MFPHANIASASNFILMCSIKEKGFIILYWRLKAVPRNGHNTEILKVVKGSLGLIHRTNFYIVKLLPTGWFSLFWCTELDLEILQYVSRWSFHHFSKSLLKWLNPFKMSHEVDMYQVIHKTNAIARQKSSEQINQLTSLCRKWMHEVIFNTSSTTPSWCTPAWWNTVERMHIMEAGSLELGERASYNLLYSMYPHGKNVQKKKQDMCGPDGAWIYKWGKKSFTDFIIPSVPPQKILIGEIRLLHLIYRKDIPGP